MLRSVLKSKFGYEDFKNDIQKQATTAIHKGFCKMLIFFGLLFLAAAISSFYAAFSSLFFMSEYFIKVNSKNIDDFRKTRCIRVYAHGFWEISLFSITSDNE